MVGENNIIDIDAWVAQFVAKHDSEGKEEFEKWLSA